MTDREQPERSIKLKTKLLPVLVIILVAAQLFFPFKGWVILLSGLGGMWLIAFFWARALKQSLNIFREIRFDWKQVGDRLRERVLLENNGWAPGLWVEIDDHSDMSDYEISLVTDVRSWRYQNWNTQGVCSQRGLYTLGPVTLKAGDPFGIYQVTVDYTDSVNMMVAPPVIPLPEIEIASGERVGEGSIPVRSLRQTVSAGGVREYVPGDSLRWLHWPTTARIGEPYVHIFDDEPASDWWVLLDMDSAVHVGEGKNSTEEHGVILAASLVNRGLQTGKNVGLISYGDELIWEPPAMGDAHLWKILRGLAKIHPGEGTLQQVLERLRTSLGARSSLIIITPNVTPDWLNGLELLKRNGIVPTVILLDPVSFGGEETTHNLRRRLSRMGVTQHTIRQDLLARPENKLKEELDFLLRQTRRTGYILDTWQQRWQNFSRVFRIAILIFIFYAVMAATLGGIVRGVESYFIGSMLAGGAIAGALLAASTVPGWFATILSVALGVFATIMQVGQLGNTLINITARFARLLPDMLAWAFQLAEKPDFRPLQLRIVELSSGMSALFVRIGEWLNALFQGQSYYDPVAITSLWGFAIWLVAAWSLWWTLRRKQPLSGLAPAVALTAISLGIVIDEAYNLIFLLGATVALMILMNHDTREGLWLSSRLSFTPAIRKKIILAAVSLSFGLMAFALVVPSISIDRLVDFARRVTGDRLVEPEIAESFGLERNPDPDEVDILAASLYGGLPNDHLIGSGPELSEQVVMVVQIEKFSLPDSAAGAEPLPTPLYLRSLAYDRYTGRGWESGPTITREYAPGDSIPLKLPKNAEPVRQQVQFVESEEGLLYTPGIPLSVDQDFKVAWRRQDSQNGIYDSLGAMVNAGTYRVDSLVENRSLDELQNAGQNYPDWIRERYLALPASVPDNVRALAIELTATEISPYDRAVALERYLRQFPYTLDVRFPPAGVDITDYFLFTLQEGYCDYYATAMVVLARAAGLPARYVVGYLAEHYDPEIDAYIITADQAHSWVEIYFPDLGWVPFEPTGGRPGIERPLEAFPELPDDFELNLAPLVPKKDLSQTNWSMIVGLGFLVLVVVSVALIWLLDWRRDHLPVADLLPRIYGRLYRFADWLGFTIRPGVTPYEFAHQVGAYTRQLGQGSYWAGWLLEGVPMLREITELFVEVKFNPSNEINLNARQINQLYKQLRIRLWVLWLLGIAYRYPFIRPFLWEDAPLSVTLSFED